MKERVGVIDNYCQKLTDSGYQHDQVRKVVTGGLTGYERRRGLSMLDSTDRKFRPLHESRTHNAKNRRIAKMMSKQNWFKKKPEDPEESPSKKRRIDLKDARSMETLPEDWMTFQKDWKGPREGMHGPDSGRTSDDIDDQPSNHPDEPESQQAGSSLNGNLEKQNTPLSNQKEEHD